jgi:hypothetical protein
VLLAVLIFDTLAQQVTDYYFDHNFYDLQQNWHYMAYGLYAYIFYRDLRSRGLPLHKMMLITFISAFCISFIDEEFQKFMSNRVFDVCDIGKDVWGVYMGMLIVYTSGKNNKIFFKDWKTIQHKNLRGYYKHPFTLALLMFILGFLFLSFGSVLTETEYALLVFIITITAFILVFMALHLTQYRAGKFIVFGIIVVAIVTQGYFFIKYRGSNIVHSQYGLTIYKGIPIPFFDIMIYQNGAFRLVDKKHLFNQRDIRFLLKRKPDILLISSGEYGKGGKGFSDPQHLFMYNRWAKEAIQVIIQKNSDANQTFNRLKKENKKVLYVIHNTC